MLRTRITTPAEAAVKARFPNAYCIDDNILGEVPRYTVYTTKMRRIAIGFALSKEDAWRAAESNLIDEALRQPAPTKSGVPTHAIQELLSRLDTHELNEPIFRLEGKEQEADHCASVAASLRGALALLNAAEDAVNGIWPPLQS